MLETHRWKNVDNASKTLIIKALCNLASMYLSSLNQLSKHWLEGSRLSLFSIWCPPRVWEIDGETVETVSDFIFGGSKITADGDCSLEIKRCFRWVQFSCSVMSDSLWSHGLQHTWPPCPSPTPKAYSDSCPLSQWCHPTISSSVISFSSCLQSFPASGSFQMCQFFASGGQNIGISASALVLPKNIQEWFPLRLTGCISLQSKGLSRVFSI